MKPRPMMVYPFYLWMCVWLPACQASVRQEDTITTPLFPRPAIPSSTLNPSEALKYIAETDQADRAILGEQDLLEILQHKSSKMDSINRRDSIRYVLLWDLHVQALIKTPQDKYNAGVVFTHSGGPSIGDDSLSWRIAERYFTEASQEGDSSLRVKALDFLWNVQWRFKPRTNGIHIERAPIDSHQK